MSAVFSGNTAGAGGMCSDFDENATQLNSALADAEILTNGVLTLTKIDGSTFTNNIPYFADFVIQGLKLTISNVPVNRTLTYTAGTYQINAQLYSIPVGANFQLTAGHPTLPRIDILYLTNTNNIIYQTGTPATNPVQPTPPLGTLLLAAIGVQIGATTSLNYTLVTVNTNNTTIAPTTIADGTVNGSHLAWDGISWVENPYWIVKNSVIDPTIKIQSYDTTDVNGIITLTTLGDSNSERGFTFYVNDSLSGFNTRVDLTSSLGSETVFSVLSIDNNDFVSSLISNSSSESRIATIDLTLDRRADISNEAISNILEATLSTKDPLNLNQLVQTITRTDSSIAATNNTSTFSQDVTSLENVLSISDGTKSSILVQDENRNYFNSYNGALLSIVEFGSVKNEITSSTLSNENKFTQTPNNNEIKVADLVNPLNYTNLIQTPTSFSIYTNSANPEHISNITSSGNSGGFNFNCAMYHRYRVVTANTTILDNDYAIYTTIGFNPLTITLPATPTDGRMLVIKANSASVANPVTINGNGHLIDAAATRDLTSDFASVTLHYNNTYGRWMII